jgi:methyl-accepting chemotaxis protein
MLLSLRILRKREQRQETEENDKTIHREGRLIKQQATLNQELLQILYQLKKMISKDGSGKSDREQQVLSGLVDIHQRWGQSLSGATPSQEAELSPEAEDGLDKALLSIDDFSARGQALSKELQALSSDLNDDRLRLMDDYGRLALRLEEAIKIQGSIIDATNKYSEDRMRSILVGFKDLATYSSDIGNGLSRTMLGIMDERQSTSLSSIGIETQAIVHELDLFFKDITRLKNLSDEILQTNARQLENIKRMAEGIGEFSETIRLISLNVNIEAARVVSHGGGRGDSGKGFQVLAKNLSEFATRAQELAQDEGNTIDLAIESMKRIEVDFSRHLDELIKRVPGIKLKLDPFTGIVSSSIQNLREMVGVLDGLSKSVDDRLKAIIGQLQFQDLSRQELEHIHTFLEEAVYLKTGNEPKPQNGLEEKKKIAIAYSQIATTINERKIIRKYAEDSGIEAEIHETLAGSIASEDLVDGSIKLF